jgi:hypothetical protein
MAPTLVRTHDTRATALPTSGIVRRRQTMRGRLHAFRLQGILQVMRQSRQPFQRALCADRIREEGKYRPAARAALYAAPRAEVLQMVDCESSITLELAHVPAVTTRHL